MVPSIGFEPMTFPMSRERATAAPTGLKSLHTTQIHTSLHLVTFVDAFPRAGTSFMLQSAAPTGLKCFLLRDSIFIIAYSGTCCHPWGVICYTLCRRLAQRGVCHGRYAGGALL